MSVDINYLKHNFFYFDKPVDYILENKSELKIYPVSLRESEFFLSSKDILEVDKNSFPDVKIIQMSYLQFLNDILLHEEVNKQKLFNILKICLKFENPYLILGKNKKNYLIDKNQGIIINSKEFDDIKRIILYQNIVDYDDEYINPELKRKLNEELYLKNKNIDIPSLERKIAIITAHTGLSKLDQLEMTYRSHSLLFDEVYAETEYVTLYPLAAYCGKTDKVDKWIYKIKKEKFADQVVSVGNFNKQAGGDGNIQQKIINNKEE